MMRRPDVLLLTALPDEYEQVIAVREGLVDGGWRAGPPFEGLPTSVASFAHADGGTISVMSTWCTLMGLLDCAHTATRLVEMFAPASLAMSGVCAGRRGKVAQGDVVFADRVWTWDAGKLVVDEDGVERFAGDPHQYEMPRSWLRRLQAMEGEVTLGAGVRARPEPLDRQERWLMGELHDGHDPLPAAERKARCPDLSLCITRLRKRKLLQPTGLALTDAGAAAVVEERLHHPDGEPVRAAFRAHVAPMASGQPVVEDAGLFDRLAIRMRKVAALDMEAAALGSVAHAYARPFVVGKGVQDHADPDKDDRFRTFAARASAELVLAFVRSAPRPEAVRGELGPGGGIRLASGSEIAGDVEVRDVTIREDGPIGVVCESRIGGSVVIAGLRIGDGDGEGDR